MRRYETILILDPDLSEDGRQPVIERISGLIPQLGGMLVEYDHWGSRKLAYEIKKKQRGYYLRVDYCGTGAVVDELERFGRIDDRVMKYMTVQLDPEADVEEIQAQMAARDQAEAEEADADAQPAAETPPETTPEHAAEPAPAATAEAPEAAPAEDAPPETAEPTEAASESIPTEATEKE